MKLSRLVGAVVATILLAALPVRAAEQSTFVMPTAGPMDMATYSAGLNSALRAITSCSWGTSAPANGPSSAPIAYQCWADTTSNPVVFKRYDGAQWVTFGKLNTSTHAWTPSYQGTDIGNASTGTIGSTVQAWDADLDALAALSGTDTIYRRSGAATWSPVTIGGLLSFSGGTLNVGDAELVALAGLTSANNKCFYFTGSGSSATYDCSSFGRSVANAADAAALRTLAGVVIGTDVQAADADLDALAANATNGLWAHTGAGTGAARTLTAPAAGLTITNPAGTAGNPTFVLANDLAAVEGLGCTGLAIRSATDTWLCRTIGGTANEISVANGDGVGSAPTFSLPSALTFTGKTITGGTYSGAAFSGVSDVQGTLKLTGFVTATAIAANQNDYTATDGSNTCSTKAVLRLSATGASRNVTGLSCGQAEGDIKIIHNVGSQNIVLTNQDTGSTAANRFLFGGDVTLQPDYSITVKYDAVTLRWRAITTASSGGGGGGTVTSVGIVGAGLTVNSGTCTVTTSGTCTLTTTAATKSDQQTGTSTTTVVTPAQQQSHASAAKAWFTMDTCSTASCSVSASYNITSVARNNSGDYTATFTTPFSSTNYACIAINGSYTARLQTKTTSTVQIQSFNSAASGTDSPVDVVCFGGQ